MPVFSLRLPETLEADARAKAAWLGISMNALVCVAVDAYLHGVALQPVAEPASPTTSCRPPYSGGKYPAIQSEGHLCPYF